MTTHDFLANYDAKVMEYLLAVTYLLLFVPMWRYVHAPVAVLGAQATARTARQIELTPATQPALGWFHAPAGIALHPGHTWARVDADGLVTVGIDDFAQKLIDPSRLVLPRAGDHVLQGQVALALGDQVVTIPMVSPVGGTVVAVNGAARGHPEVLHEPYGAGWLFKVEASQLEQDQRGLLTGERARAWLEDSATALARSLDPEHGRLLQDGGTPIRGIARALAGEGWADLACRLLAPDRRTP